MGHLYSCGSNDYGQLGLGQDRTFEEVGDFTRVGIDGFVITACASLLHGAAITGKGRLWTGEMAQKAPWDMETQKTASFQQP